MAFPEMSVQGERPWSGAELGTELIRSRHEIDAMEPRFSILAAEFAKTEEYDHQGSLSPVGWMRFNCSMTSNAAADRLAVGEQLDQLPESCHAMAQGRIGTPLRLFMTLKLSIPMQEDARGSSPQHSRSSRVG